jgi:DNA gyrase subunit A
MKAVTIEIEYLRGLLADPLKLRGVIKDELKDLAGKYGDDRRTEIVAGEAETINIEDLIKDEEMVITVSNMGYIKRVPVTAYRSQARGGKGMQAAKLVDEDFIKQLFVASTHEYISFISSVGKAYWLKVHELPEASRTGKGEHVKGLLQLAPGEEIAAIVGFKDFTDDRFLILATANGVVKRLQATELSNAKTRGITAIKLDEGDKLVGACSTGGKDDIMLISKNGKALRYNESVLRPMGRTARGVTGMKFSDGDELMGILRVDDSEKMLLVSENGYGKRVEYTVFSSHGRGTGGQRVFGTNDKSGQLAACVSVKDGDEIMTATSQGMSIKVNVDDIRVMGVGASGVRVFKIEKPDFVIGADRIVKDEK